MLGFNSVRFISCKMNFRRQLYLKKLFKRKKCPFFQYFLYKNSGLSSGDSPSWSRQCQAQFRRRAPLLQRGFLFLFSDEKHYFWKIKKCQKYESSGQNLDTIMHKFYSLSINRPSQLYSVQITYKCQKDRRFDFGNRNLTFSKQISHTYGQSK